MEPLISWYGQSSVRVDAEGLRVYVDPYRLPPNQPPADLIFVSHEHGDHLSLPDIERVRTADTLLYASRLAAQSIPGLVTVLEPGDHASAAGVHIRTIPAYTVDKLRASGEPAHPKASGGLGLILEIGEHSFYFAGDTDLVPEMAEVGPVDFAFLPVGGRLVMTAEEAARAAAEIQPSVAVPVHYGLATGTIDDARRFAELVPDQVRVWIPEQVH